jgi:type I restriction enzyme S subunit
MSSETVPNQWLQVPLRELVSKLVDGSHNPPPKQADGLPMLSAVNIFDNEIQFSSYRLIHPDDFAVEDCRTKIETGDVLLTIVGAIGRAAVVPSSFRHFTLQRSVAVISPILVDSKFLMHQLESPRLASFFEENARGTAQKGVYLNTLGETQIWVPPLGEQRRIVAKLEELLSELDKGVETLKTAQLQLKAYRQAVLKQAFEGKLTADWRNKKNDECEPGDTLRKRILQTRRNEWEQSEIRRFRELDSLPSNDRWKERYNEPEPFDNDQLPSLPSQWCWAGLDELVSGKPRSMQSGPFGSNLKHSEFRNSGVLVIGIDNVRDGWFSMGSQNRISDEKFQELAKYQARPGDLLITVMASLGRTCVVPRDIETAIITKHVYRISMEEDLLYPEYFNLLLQSQAVSRVRMFKSAQGQTRPGLNSSILKALPIPLCSRLEQVEIVARLSSQLSNIDKMLSEVDDQITRSVALRQSILKKAFSGHLVARGARDEPASMLLDRIKAEREESRKRGKKTNRKKEAA